MGRYRFWIHKKDAQGKPLNEQLVTAAEEAAPTLARYRQQEINCESTTNQLLQAAVEAASKAERQVPIRNTIGYITFVYKRLVDRFLDRENKVVPVEDSFLETLADSGARNSFEDAIHNRLMLEKILDHMDPDTRRICLWRLQGYSINEIAKELGMKPNTVSAQYIRGIEKAAESVGQTTLRGNNNGKPEAV